MRRLVALLLVSCATARSAEGELPRSEVDVLLRNAARLQLTARQIEQLERIEIRRWNRSERERIDRQVKRLDATSGENSRRGHYRDDLAKRIATLGEPPMPDFDRKASEEARALLDGEQLAAAEPYLRAWHHERARRLREEDE